MDDTIEKIIEQYPNVDRKKLENILKLEENKDLAMLEVLQSINEGIKAIAEKEMPEMEMPDTHKVEILGVEVVTIKGEKGEKGDVGEKGEQGDKGLDGKDGKNGIDGQNGLDGLDGKDGVDGKNGNNGSPDTPEQVKEKLLQVGLIIDDVEDLRKELDDLKKKWSSRPIFGGGFNVGAMNFHFYHDEVGTGDGVTTVFSLDNIPSPSDSLEVWVGSANLWVTDDYTLSGSQITFLTAPPTGAKIRAKYRT